MIVMNWIVDISLKQQITDFMEVVSVVDMPSKLKKAIWHAYRQWDKENIIISLPLTIR